MKLQSLAYCNRSAKMDISALLAQHFDAKGKCHERKYRNKSALSSADKTAHRGGIQPCRHSSKPQQEESPAGSENTRLDWKMLKNQIIDENENRFHCLSTLLNLTGSVTGTDVVNSFDRQLDTLVFQLHRNIQQRHLRRMLRQIVQLSTSDDISDTESE